MDPETEKIIKEQMLKLPEEIQSIFSDPELGEKILNIGRKNGIVDVEKLGIFQTETNLMMLGLVHIDDYPDELKNRLNIDSIKTDNIVNDMNIQILLGMKDKLREVYENDYEFTEEDENEILKELEKEGNWKQNLDFVLSGGDYFVFTERNNEKNTADEAKKTTTLNNSRRIEDIKSKFTI